MLEDFRVELVAALSGIAQALSGGRVVPMFKAVQPGKQDLLLPMPAAGADKDAVVVLGRDKNVDFKLDDPSVVSLASRRHAIVLVAPHGKVTVFDCGSTNGTYVKSSGQQQATMRRLQPFHTWKLKHGDVIGFGGPETVVKDSRQPNVVVPNPLLFEFRMPTAVKRSHQGAPTSSSSSPRPQKKPGLDADQLRAWTDMKQCPACLEDHDDADTRMGMLECGHAMCGRCMASLKIAKEVRMECPLCRAPIKHQLKYPRSADNAIAVHVLDNELKLKCILLDEAQ